MGHPKSVMAPDWGARSILIGMASDDNSAGTRDRGRKSGSLRRQLVFATVSVQCVLVLGFLGLSVWQDWHGAQARLDSRLRYQADFLAASAARPLASGDMDTLEHLLDVQRRATNVRDAQITDPRGRAIANTDGALNGRDTLQDDELAAAGSATTTRVVKTADGEEGVAPVIAGGRVIALAWIYPDNTREHQQLSAILRTGMWYALLTLLANALVSLLLARSVLKPVHTLVGGTRRVAEGAEPGEVFPLRVASNNEIGELTDAFNDMVESLEKQRGGLNDTLALLDSMLANAPVGFAFLDRKARFVRVNQYLADMNQQPISRHLGHSVGEILAPGMAATVESLTARVFETGESLRDYELVSGRSDPRTMRSWLANFFPVRSSGDKVRWVGIIVSETTERKQTEEALRRTEKLAATGRLAASIAHEINNPLEGITNLLYLLRHDSSLDEQAQRYAEMAQYEVARVSEITQQTLRFYRQSTLPVTVSLAELVESVLVLYHGKIHAAQVTVEKRFAPDTAMFGLSGELRQLIANLVGNAVDAMPFGGRLVLKLAPSHDWATGEAGMRLTCADTGHGMEQAVRRRIFEAFFTTKESTGTGLGLWVSAEILGKHKATVRVRSRTKLGALDGRGGSVFMIFFPENGVAERATVEAEAAEVGVDPS
jgi:signal transduction histidine kinase